MFRVLFKGQSPKIVQSMFFEGNSATWEHQDSYYLDSEVLGAMAAGWIALEDIDASAGRFFVCPGSHKIDTIKQGRHNNIADNHDVYIGEVVEQIQNLNLQIHAPFLKKGDVLFWNTLTIHGSLDSQSQIHSRSSITCHAIPDGHRFLKLHSRILDLSVDVVNGVSVYRPKDLAKYKNRLIFNLESNFPTIFYALKRLAVRSVIKYKSGK